jgi:hypothetical protein
MSDSYEAFDSSRIGLVSAVDANHVTVQLDLQVSGLVKASAFGVVPIGAVNSYVCMPVAHFRAVARVDRIRMQQAGDRDDTRDRDAIIVRTLETTIVGRLEKGRFDSGLTAYPSLFTPVHAATDEDLDLVLAVNAARRVRIGTAPSAGDRAIHVDADKLLARHTLIVGTTGAGKSCTVTGILDALFEQPLPSANIIVFDSNGEYTQAFKQNAHRKERTAFLSLGPDTGAASGLLAPHWLMNTEEHLSLFRASEGIQAPLLQRAIADARTAIGGIDAERRRLQSTSAVLTAIRALVGGGTSKKPQEPLTEQLSSLHTLVSGFAAMAPDLDHWAKLEACLGAWDQLGLNATSWNPPNASQIQGLTELCEDVEALLRDGLNALGLGSSSSGSDFDAPVPYSLQDLADRYLPARISLESRLDPRVSNYVTGLSMRLARMLADSRYDFITRVPSFDRPLARFLRLLLGWGPVHCDEGENQVPWAELLTQQGATADSKHAVTVLDLSLIASDVLEDVTALLGRVILDLMVRVHPRGALPTLLILEEAHRYVPSGALRDRSRSSQVFERIAREGRKFGLSLMLATQRPSELSSTVASQCGTVIAHRLSNAADQELLRYASPYSSRGVLEQLAGLAQQHALVMGESVSTPTLIRIRDVPDAPHGQDPSFIEAWSRTDFDGGGVIDAVAEQWQPSSLAPAAEAPTGSTTTETVPLPDQPPF